MSEYLPHALVTRAGEGVGEGVFGQYLTGVLFVHVYNVVCARISLADIFLVRIC